MPVFEDAGPALTALREEGWRLAILTNCDDDLFATTRPRLPAPFDLVFTAQQVGSYKPDLGHFRAFADQTLATRRTGSTWPTAGYMTSCPRPGWACARSGSTATAPGIPPSWPSGA